MAQSLRMSPSVRNGERRLSSPFTVRFVRTLMPVVVLLAGVGAVAFVVFSDSVEGAFKLRDAGIAALVTLLLLFVWVLFLSGLRWRRRVQLLLAGVTVPVVGVFVLHHFVRREGSVDGSGMPRIVWRSEMSAELPAVQATAPSGSAVELVSGPEDYPRFLGVGGNNRVEGVHLSRDWKTTPPKELWRRPIGLGWGSFAIVNGFAVTQAQREADEVTTCLDMKTGEVRWRHLNAARFHESYGGDGPRATPTVSDGRVYVMGATGLLDCLDGATGKPIWSRDILADAHAANLEWGKSCSPLICDRLVVVSGGARGPSLLAYDKVSGAPAWQSGTDAASYASPTLAMLAGRRMLLSVNAHSVGGYDPASGDVVFNYAWPGDWPKAAQPVPLEDDRVFICAGYGLGSEVLKVNAGAAAPRVLWHNLRLKAEYSNVVVRDGFVYGLDDGVLTCLDLKNGKRRWRDGRYGHGEILLVDDLILVQTEPGDLALVEATPDRFNELATAPALNGKTWNNPALSGHVLLVRNDHEAVALQLP